MLFSAIPILETAELRAGVAATVCRARHVLHNRAHHAGDGPHGIGGRAAPRRGRRAGQAIEPVALRRPALPEDRRRGAEKQAHRR